MLETIRQYLRYTSWPILAAMVTLMGVGLAAINASEQADAGMTGFTAKQLVSALIALAAFVAATLIPYRRLGNMAYPLFGLTLALLVALVAAKYAGFKSSFMPNIRGAYRWIGTGIGDVMIQVSELAKITFILLLAWRLRRGDHYRRLGGLVMPFVLTLVPMALILLEPDLGTSMLFLPTLYFMLYMAGAKLRHLLSIVAIATVLIFVPLPVKVTQSNATRQPLAYWTFQRNGTQYMALAASLAKMEDHQVSRIQGWLLQNDASIKRGKGWQLELSKIVMGSGRWTGSRDWQDADSVFRMLPDDHTDFIFAVVGGQWGFAGCAAVLFLYGVIFVFGVEIAVVTKDPFGRLLAVGVLALMFTQLVINVGMTMGLMPVTGMTLPFISYGGSSLVINGFAMGLLVNVGQCRPILLGRRPFEFDHAA